MPGLGQGWERPTARSASAPCHRRLDGGSPCGRDKRGPSREWLQIGLVLGLCRAVLPCAPRARTQVGELPSNWPSASTKAAGHGRGERKVCENRRAGSKAIALSFVAGTGAGGGRAGARPSRAWWAARSQQVAPLPWACSCRSRYLLRTHSRKKGFSKRYSPLNS